MKKPRKMKCHTEIDGEFAREKNKQKRWGCKSETMIAAIIGLHINTTLCAEHSTQNTQSMTMKVAHFHALLRPFHKYTIVLGIRFSYRQTRKNLL